MPFNSIQPEKVTLLFLKLLKLKRNNEIDRISLIESQNNNILDNRITDLIKPINNNNKIKYIPGLLLISNPQDGYILGYIDFSFLAALFYVIGSLCYMVSSVLNWYENSYGYTTDTIFNLLASLSFIINVIFCFIDWYIQRKQILTFCEVEAKYNKDGVVISKDGIVMLNDNSLSWSSSLKVNMLYFWNNVYFLFAAIVYTFQGIALLNYDIIAFCNTNTFCNNFYMNFLGSLFYVLSGYYSLKEYILTRQIRDNENLPQLPLFNTSYLDLDWFGWGNICYMPAGLTAFIQSFTSNFGIHNNDDDNAFNFVYLLGNWFFTINSIQYFIGYMIFIYKMKKALEESLAEVESIRINGNDDVALPESAATTVKNLCNDPHQSHDILDRLTVQDRHSLSGLSMSRRNTENISTSDNNPRFSARETVVNNPHHNPIHSHNHNGNQKIVSDIAITEINKK